MTERCPEVTLRGPIRDHICEIPRQPAVRGTQSAALAAMDASLDLSKDPTKADPKEGAVWAGLRYVSDEYPGLRRRRAGHGFCYLRSDGTRIAAP